MHASRRINKGLAFFVLAFLCLNIGGAICLTMCTSLFAAETTAASDAHLSEHCKQAKKAAEERERGLTKIDAGEASCCMMPVGLFAAPVEKRPEFKVVPTVAAVSLVFDHEFSAPAIFKASLTAAPVYRPPPLDRRGERILRSVFRI